MWVLPARKNGEQVVKETPICIGYSGDAGVGEGEMSSLSSSFFLLVE